jgi:hypothetical protein
LTVYSVGAAGLIMSAVGAGAGPEFARDSASAWMAASVAVSSGAAVATGPVSAGAAGCSTGAEWWNIVAQPLLEIAAAATITDRTDLEAWLKVILPSSTMGWGSSTAVIIACGPRHTT